MRAGYLCLFLGLSAFPAFSAPLPSTESLSHVLAPRHPDRDFKNYMIASGAIGGAVLAVGGAGLAGKIYVDNQYDKEFHPAQPAVSALKASDVPDVDAGAAGLSKTGVAAFSVGDTYKATLEKLATLPAQQGALVRAGEAATFAGKGTEKVLTQDSADFFNEMFGLVVARG